MPDPIRVTRAVRRCPVCRGRGYSGEPDNPNETPCPDCTVLPESEWRVDR